MSRPTVICGSAPLIVSIPHAGTDIPPDVERNLISPWLGRKDADWWVDELYGFATRMGATVIRSAVSRTVIDVNRDPSGRSLYPGMTTTELCPTTTFDGEPLYREGYAPDAKELARRKALYFTPYHEALAAEIARLRRTCDKVVLWDAHSIRSHTPRLFDGELPQLNFGTNGGRSCAAQLIRSLEGIAADTPYSRVTDGRFRGGYITRHYGAPAAGVHAVQLELAMRSYMAEVETPLPGNWPSPFDADRAAGLQGLLGRFLQIAIDFASGKIP